MTATAAVCRRKEETDLDVDVDEDEDEDVREERRKRDPMGGWWKPTGCRQQIT